MAPSYAAARLTLYQQRNTVQTEKEESERNVRIALERDRVVQDRVRRNQARIEEREQVLDAEAQKGSARDEAMWNFVLEPIVLETAEPSDEGPEVETDFPLPRSDTVFGNFEPAGRNWEYGKDVRMSNSPPPTKPSATAGSARRPQKLNGRPKKSRKVEESEQAAYRGHTGLSIGISELVTPRRQNPARQSNASKAPKPSGPFQSLRRIPRPPGMPISAIASPMTARRESIISLSEDWEDQDADRMEVDQRSPFLFSMPRHRGMSLSTLSHITVASRIHSPAPDVDDAEWTPGSPISADLTYGYPDNIKQEESQDETMPESFRASSTSSDGLFVGQNGYRKTSVERSPSQRPGLLSEPEFDLASVDDIAMVEGKPWVGQPTGDFYNARFHEQPSEVVIKEEPGIDGSPALYDDLFGETALGLFDINGQTAQRDPEGTQSRRSSTGLFIGDERVAAPAFDPGLRQPTQPPLVPPTPSSSIRPQEPAELATFPLGTSSKGQGLLENRGPAAEVSLQTPGLTVEEAGLNTQSLDCLGEIDGGSGIV